jgi:hypothetical protein
VVPIATIAIAIITAVVVVVVVVAASVVGGAKPISSRALAKPRLVVRDPKIPVLAEILRPLVPATAAAFVHWSVIQHPIEVDEDSVERAIPALLRRSAFRQ